MLKSYKLSHEFVDRLIEYNKIMKANILIYTYDPSEPYVIGISGEEDSFGAVKVLSKSFNLTETEYPQINFAILAKDLTMLYKYSLDTLTPIYVNVVSTPWTVDTVQYFFCNNEYKHCLNYTACHFHCMTLLYNWDITMPVAVLENIESMPEFEPLMNAKASDGIVVVRKDAMTYFIPPMVVNALKGETIDMETRFNPITKVVYILIVIHKKKGIKEFIYYTTLDNSSTDSSDYTRSSKLHLDYDNNVSWLKTRRFL